jgi:hypothetical protein
MELPGRAAGLAFAPVEWGQLSQRMRTASLLLAFFALTFKAVLPTGFMLAPSHERTITVTLCTSHGAVEVEMPQARKSGGAPSDTQQNDASPCVCAAGGAFSAPLVAAAFDAPRLAQVLDTTARTGFNAPARSLAAPPPWPTGPPISI